MRQLAERDHRHEDEADAEHDEDGLLAFLGSGLHGEQVQHGENLPQRGVRGERFVHGRVARRLAGGCLERGRVAAQPERGAGLVEARPASEEGRARGPQRAVAPGILGAQLAAERDELGQVGDGVVSPNDATRTSPCAYR